MYIISNADILYIWYTSISAIYPMKIIIIYIIILHAKWHYSRIHFSNHSIEIKDNMTFWQYPVLLYILYIILYISRALDGNRKENYLIPGIFFYRHNRSFIVIIIHSECPYKALPSSSSNSSSSSNPLPQTHTQSNKD